MPWLDTCLKSCVDYPVVVVDNGSTDETVDYINKHFPKIIVLPQTENKGFGQANNIGIRYALDQGAEQVFLLNQDAYLVSNVLDKLVQFQNMHQEYGILSPVHITADEKRLDYNFSGYMLRDRSNPFYSDFVLGNTLAAVYPVSFVNAAAWLISKHCLETVGGFDPLFFHYGEDDNYCQRVLFHGLKIGVVPKGYVIHDRADRVRSKVTEFSEHYYSKTLRIFKLKHSNLLNTDKHEKQISQLKKDILKLKLQGKFKRAAQHQKTLMLMLAASPDIMRSREINIQKGKHYLY
ncbi:glycosyltransferase (GT2) [Formosa agariphila KMM 3901]|uniref:Glycosyltransferase (GT2) n=2 Tax=Formosa TaxID=225842 RepID=T2KNL3_FORAG|nr:glycosyltransferase (GT2) [Formosa agariphila KMM 3901]